MDLRNDQKMFSAEIVINIVIKLDKDGNVENKEALQKCPHCHTGIGKVFYRGPDGGDGRSETGFTCDRCSKRWSLRFKNPILFIHI